MKLLPTKTSKRRFTYFVIFAIIGLLFFLLTSCSVQQVAQEDFFEHNTLDVKVLSYDYPYAKVLVMPDSIIETRFSLEPLKVGYLICESR